MKHKVRYPGEYSLSDYCKVLAHGVSYAASCAKTCLQIDGDTRGQMEAAEKVCEMFDKGIQTHRVKTDDRREWRDLGGGGHQRIDHMTSR